MRRLAWALLTAALLVPLAAAPASAAGAPWVFEDFEKETALKAWSLTPKDGSIALHQGSVRISIPYVQGGASDAFLQSGRNDGQNAFMVSAEMAFVAGQGNMQLVLRDSSATLQGHYIPLAKLTRDKITYLPELAANPVSENAPAGKAQITALVSPREDYIRVYCNGVQKMEVRQVSGQQGGIWSGFLWNSFSVRLQAARSGTPATVADFDNYQFCSGISGADGLLLSAPWLETDNGQIAGGVLCWNLTGQEKSVVPVLAHLRDGKLVAALPAQPQKIAGGAAARATVRMKEEQLGEKDSLKLMVLDSLETLRPLTGSITVGSGATYFAPSVPSELEVMLRLKRQHPRLMADSAQLERLQKLVLQNGTRQQLWYAKIKKQAAGYLSAALPEYQDADAMRLLASGDYLSRLWPMALVYRMEKDARYKNRIWEYLERAAGWPDWGDNHFLNTAELCFSFGIAYDWLYDDWTAEQKEVIRGALMEKGLGVALNNYQSGAWWTTLDSNWTAVCNGGVLVGALALCGEDKDCAQIVSCAFENVRQCYPQFQPDGGWYEGAGYWNYAMQFWTYMMAASQTALGTDFGHRFGEGISETGYFPLYMTGAKQIFNFGDAGAVSLSTPCLFYLGKIFEDKYLNGYRYYQLEYEGKTPVVSDLLWYDPYKVSLNFRTELAGGRTFEKIQTSVMHNGFADQTRAFAALHGGENNISHGQLDAGQFVYESGGVRWAVDLGSDAYNLFRYFDSGTANAKNRWCYYRNRAEGHNLWVMNPGQGPDQEVNGVAYITHYEFNGADACWTVADLSRVYPAAETAKRGLWLEKDTGALLVQDELTLKGQTELYWFLHTAADIQLSRDKKSAVLTAADAGGTPRRLWVGILQGTGSFSVMDAVPLSSSPNPDLWPENQSNAGDAVNPQKQNPNAGIRKLAVHLEAARGELTQAVYMTLLEDGAEFPQALPATVKPLAKWQ